MKLRTVHVALVVLGLPACASAQEKPAAPAPRPGVAADAALGDLHGGRPGAGRRPNALAWEPSPYLREHAYNPVAWRAWGPRTFEEAKRRGVPVFLSIGYSTCHWCHVMARESFEDQDVARLLNARFVPVKVDREEHPDVDDAYIQAVAAIHGSAGWPLSAFLTTDGRPFHGGTYYPRDAFKELLARIDDAWRNDRAKVLEQARRLRDHLGHAHTPAASGPTGPSKLEPAVAALLSVQDLLHGGEGLGTKFPRVPSILALLELGRSRKEARAAGLATLDAILRGGIHDHLARGFHRYATDREWRVPHFEKTLYDQALLARAFVHAWRATHEPRYAEGARSALDYTLRDLTLEGGGFAAAEDADSEGHEGRFCTFTREEVLATGLDRATAELVCARFGIELQGKGNLDGRSVLFLAKDPRDAALAVRIAPDEAAARLATGIAALGSARAARPRPRRDEKLIAGWNGLAISALARAGAALDEPRYTEAARAAAARVLRDLRNKDGRLLRRFAGGDAGAVLAALEDHAYLLEGLVDLFEATGDLETLAQARALAARTFDLFRDAGRGRLEKRARDAPTLAVPPPQSLHEGALPSPEGILCLATLRLATLGGDDDLRDRARRLAGAAAGEIEHSPAAVPTFLVAVLRLASPARELVVAGDPQAADTRALLRVARERDLPDLAVVPLDPANQARALDILGDVVRGRGPANGRAQAFYCVGKACKLPTSEPSVLIKQLEGR